MNNLTNKCLLEKKNISISLQNISNTDQRVTLFDSIITSSSTTTQYRYNTTLIADYNGYSYSIIINGTTYTGTFSSATTPTAFALALTTLGFGTFAVETTALYNSFYVNDSTNVYSTLSISVGIVEKLNSVFIPNTTNNWLICGNNGKIYKSINQGVSWTSPTSSTTQNLNSIYFASSTVGYICGNNGVILKTTDSGTTWVAQTSGTTQNLNSVRFYNTSIGWCCGDNGVILKTTNGGTTWAAQSSSTVDKLNSFFLYDTNTCWCCGNNGKIVATADGGTTWLGVVGTGTTENLNSIYMADASTGWAVGNNGVISTTVDGATWAVIPSGTTENLNSVYFYLSSNGWCCGDNGKIIATTDGGVNWTTQTSGTTENLNSIFTASVNLTWSCGDNGLFDKTTDGGTTWTDSQGTNTNYTVSIYSNVLSGTSILATTVSTTSYNQFVMSLQTNPAFLSAIDIMQSVPNLNYANFSIYTSDANGVMQSHEFTPALFSNPFYHTQGRYIKEFSELLALDINTKFANFPVPANSTVILILYYTNPTDTSFDLNGCSSIEADTENRDKPLQSEPVYTNIQYTTKPVKKDKTCCICFWMYVITAGFTILTALKKK